MLHTLKKHGDGSLAIVKRMLKAEQTMSMLHGITFGWLEFRDFESTLIVYI